MAEVPVVIEQSLELHTDREGEKRHHRHEVSVDVLFIVLEEVMIDNVKFMCLLFSYVVSH